MPSRASGVTALVAMTSLVTGPSDLGLFEVDEAAKIVQGAADQNANIIFGAVVDDAMGEHVRVTVIATGFERGAPTVTRRERSADSPTPGSRELFDVPSDILDVPSFLRED
jgi:cell division protein FtsZ